MKKTFFKNLFRDIKKSLSRFLSIVVIIAVGVAFYAGIRATSPSMKISADTYLNKHNFMDFKVISTLGLTDTDANEIGKINGVTKVGGSYSIDAIIEKDARQLVLNINSLPDEEDINNIRMIKGRKANSTNEAIVEEKFLEAYNLSLGDTISLKSENISPIEQSLKTTEFKIVGTAESPLYISEQRQPSSIGNGIVRGFVYILPQVFKSQLYTEVYVRTDNPQSKVSLLDNESYISSTKNIEESLKDVGLSRNELRYEEILKSGNYKLNEIKKPEWYILSRSENAGYETYRQDSDRMDSIGKAFPLIFFLVASLVSLTTMTRMVQEKRLEIGILKALGYSKTAIISHYLIYALSASIIGSLIGIFVGFRLFPSLIMNAYAVRYTIADKVVPFNTKLALLSAIIAILFTVAAAVASTLEELREVPASLLRPKPPKSGKKILLERFTFIWKRFNFTKKVTARNIFRYKQRLFMTAVGIAACTGLMITAFGLKEGIIGAVENQFNNIYKYDMQGILSQTVNEGDKNTIKTNAVKALNIKSLMFAYSKTASVKTTDAKNQDAYLVAPENKDEFNSYINLTMDGKNLNLDNDGIVITKKLSKLLNRKIGEDIEIVLEDKTFKAKISAITEHYIQHYIYISPNFYEKLTGNKVTFNSFYGFLNNLSEEAKNDTLNTLKGFKDFSSVEFKTNLHVNYNKITSTINSVIPVLIVSAGVLAFVVIFNLTNINIAERKRELATIKLLGFYNHELASYIYRENLILTFLGSLAGIPIGIVLNKFIMATAETNDIMFFQKISPITYLISILLTLFFSVIVNLAMYNRFDKIDMIESLKSAE